ncbi:MAG TPA: hypothetical protein VEG33_08725, partial [Streptosporangiaceae bacterium]|nr:hypothetical protein [Streptosporangiaceae bacterium]
MAAGSRTQACPLAAAARVLAVVYFPGPVLAALPGRAGKEINGPPVQRTVPEKRGLWPCPQLRRGA